MKFFTRKLYDSLQGYHDMPVEYDWDAVCERYLTHINALRFHLPKSMQEFCDISLHDGIVEAVSQAGDEIHLSIDGSDCLEFECPLQLIFREVKLVQGIEDITGDWWLYEEVHPSGVASFEYHVLLERSEFVVAADDVELIRKDNGIAS